MSADAQRALEAAPGLARGGRRRVVARGPLGRRRRRCAPVRVVRAAADPVLMSRWSCELGAELRDYARDLLGVTELDQRVSQLMPPGPRSVEPRRQRPARERALRVQGALLLRAAAEVDADDGAHPPTPGS